MVTDEMVEKAAEAYWMQVYGRHRKANKWPDDVYVSSQKLFRDGCRAALEAALSTDAEPVKTSPDILAKELLHQRRMIVSHATMGRTDGEGQSVNDICVTITKLRNELYAEAQKTAPAVAVKDLEPEDPAVYRHWEKDELIAALIAERTLSAQVQDVAVPALAIGIYGKAYDRPDERRAYTYDEQPHNVEAYKLGRVCSEIHSGGDWIDRGLNLLKALQREGFGVFELPASPASKHGDAE